VYSAPYPTPESRLPLLQWSRSMPLDGEPADVVARIEAYDRWLASSPDVPKLAITFDPGPGLLMGDDALAWCAANVAGLELENCGRAGHHPPPRTNPTRSPRPSPAGSTATTCGSLSRAAARRSRPHGDRGRSNELHHDTRSLPGKANARAGSAAPLSAAAARTASATVSWT
jgi:hypothetical protein